MTDRGFDVSRSPPNTPSSSTTGPAARVPAPLVGDETTVPRHAWFALGFRTESLHSCDALVQNRRLRFAAFSRRLARPRRSRTGLRVSPCAPTRRSMPTPVTGPASTSGISLRTFLEKWWIAGPRSWLRAGIWQRVASTADNLEGHRRSSGPGFRSWRQRSGPQGNDTTGQRTWQTTSTAAECGYAVMPRHAPSLLQRCLPVDR